MNSYYGDRCEFYNPCWSSPCQHGATCLNLIVGTFRCQCQTGYYGPTCADIDGCASSPCQNGALCRNTSATGNYECACAAGYVGPTCAEYDPCSEQSLSSLFYCSAVTLRLASSTLAVPSPRGSILAKFHTQQLRDPYSEDGSGASLCGEQPLSSIFLVHWSHCSSRPQHWPPLMPPVKFHLSSMIRAVRMVRGRSASATGVRVVQCRAQDGSSCTSATVHRDSTIATVPSSTRARRPPVSTGRRASSYRGCSIGARARRDTPAGSVNDGHLAKVVRAATGPPASRRAARTSAARARPVTMATPATKGTPVSWRRVRLV